MLYTCGLGLGVVESHLASYTALTILISEHELVGTITSLTNDCCPVNGHTLNFAVTCI